MATANGGESNNAESTDKRYTAIDVHLSVQNGTKKEWKQRTATQAPSERTKKRRKKKKKKKERNVTENKRATR